MRGKERDYIEKNVLNWKHVFNFWVIYMKYEREELECGWNKVVGGCLNRGKHGDAVVSVD